MENPLSLHPVEAKHAEILFSWRQQSNMLKFNPLARVDLEELREIISKDTSDLTKISDDTSYRSIIKIESKIVGNVALNAVNSRMKTAIIGYSVDQEFQGKGIGHHAVKMLVKKVFEETDFRKLIAYVHTENIASRKILEKTGFKLEGVLREHFLINDQPVDEAIYGILRKDHAKLYNLNNES